MHILVMLSASEVGKSDTIYVLAIRLVPWRILSNEGKSGARKILDIAKFSVD